MTKPNRRQTDMSNEGRPQQLIELLAGRWTLAVLAELAVRSCRYQDLDDALHGISHKAFASYCTSVGCSGRSPFVEPASHVLDESGVAGFGRLVEPAVLVVDGVGDEQAGGVPDLDGGNADAEALGELFLGEQATGAQTVAVALKVVLVS
jgi:hypothetical protein